MLDQSNIFQRWHLYGLVVPPVITTGTQYLLDRVIQIRDLPGPYELRALSTFDLGGGKSIRCRNGIGNYFIGPDFAPVDMLTEGSGAYFPVWPSLEYAYDTAFRFDVRQFESEALADLWMILHGAHRVAAPQGLKYYPANVAETPYYHSITATLSANQVQKLSIYLRFNTPFAIRGLSSHLAGDSLATFETLVQLRDERGQAFFNQPLPVNVAFPGGSTPLGVMPSPELVIPAGSAYTLEITTGAGVNTESRQFVFTGALLNAI